MLRGQARIRAWRDEHLLAVQIPGAVDDLPQDTRQIVKNENTDYRRTYAPEKGLPVATVNAKDIVGPDQLDERSATCGSRCTK